MHLVSIYVLGYVRTTPKDLKNLFTSFFKNPSTNPKPSLRHTRKKGKRKKETHEVRKEKDKKCR